MFAKKTNIAAQQPFGEPVNTGQIDAFDDLVTADSVDHEPAPGQSPGPRGCRDLLTELRTAFPDIHVEVEHLTTTEDDVAIADTMTGTNDGPFRGNAPTGEAIKARGMQIGRFADRKLVERWGSSDQLGIMTQLGLMEA
ncbi:MAG: ester cyclase [Trebonia sp.]